ncbi:solute carrier organic anion transporter family member 4A1-like, partial [Mercenaria mercenaria]|uniref:solute carrier organic anion transporter family member 4A1-like n=1 Tax=Mercenaria mercenaria TaxID=6596 RepID=UPI00234EC186
IQTCYSYFVSVIFCRLDITPMDPRWVGAWWIPFLISGAAMFIIAIPIFGYPKRLPGSLAIQQQRKSETSKHANDELQQNFGKNWRNFPRAMFNLIRNPTFLFLSLSACVEGMIISGVATFGAKFLQEKFNLPAAFASFIMGIITVPGAGGGMLLGGFIVKKRKLKCKGIIRMNMIAAFLGIVLGCVFLLQCPAQNIAGVTSEYITVNSYNGPVNLDHQCNTECACSGATYEPVCGMDTSIYFTPCHAGCNEEFVFMEGPMGPFKMYTNCSCVAASIMYNLNLTMQHEITMTTPTTTPVSVTTEGMSANTTGPPLGAYQGICMSDCKLLYVVAPLLFFGMLVTFMTCSPTQTATMRCVQGHQRSLAIGFQWLLLRLLGTTPGPLMLGSIMDSACHVWQDICGTTGNCWIYEKTSMGIKLFVWWITVKIAALAFYFAAQYFYKPLDEVSDDEAETDEGTMNTVESESDEKKDLNFLDVVECKESVI